MPHHVYVYVGSLLQSFGERRTGIPRVEWEIARRLIDDGAVPFAFDSEAGCFAHLSDGVLQIADRVQQLDLEALIDAPRSASGHVLSRAIARMAASAYPRMPRPFGIHWHTERLALHQLVRAFDAMTPEERRDVLRRMGIASGSGLEGKLLERLSRRADGSRVITWHIARPVAFERDAVIVNCGIWWHDAALEQMRRLREELKARYVGVIHDLSPILRPNELVSAEVGQGFRRFLDASLGFANRLLPVSEHVARDVAAYAGRQGIAAPEMNALRLAPGIGPGMDAVRSPRLLRAGLHPGRFVPFVSTLNPRKGHRRSLALWRRVVDELGDKAPTLVWAGQRGRPDDGALGQATGDARLWQRHLHFIEGPSDAEVAWLYGNAAYTIYPSAFEGWGLPISESLAFGKYCLAADNTSLTEAGAGLAFHAPADNTDAWLSEIRRLAREPGYLAAMTERVVARYRPRSWDDVAGDVAAAVRAVAA